jgi:hypothetical protein
MSQRICPRCHTVLLIEDSGTLIYCSHCGAPQVMLSEELRERAAESASLQAGSTSTENFVETGLSSLDTSDATAVDWTEAVRISGWGGLIALALGLISVPFPPVGFLGLLWALTAPIVILGIYCGRRKTTRIRPGFGARLGLITGLAIAAAMSTVGALDFILERFVIHRGADLDAAMATITVQLQQAQAANQQPMPFNLAIPEFRVGLFLACIGTFICFYLAYAVISGAFGGLMRSNKRTA